MKIYFILCDTVPLNNQLKQISKFKKANLLIQISNSFTLSSLLSLFTGKLPSDILEKGLGYHTTTNQNIKGKKQKWYNSFLLKTLIQKENWNIVFHNSYLLSKHLFFDENIKETSSFPGGPSSEKLSAWDAIEDELLSNSNKAKSLDEKEKSFIKSFQNEKTKRNTLYFISYHHYHTAISKQKNKKEIAKNKINDLIQQWDLSEPESLFIFFSDHGDWEFIDKHCTPPHPWLSWAMIKNNISDSKIRQSLISITDYYPTLSEFIPSLKDTHSSSHNIFNKQDKDRVYFMEDSRANINLHESTTFSAIQVVQWDDNDIPILFKQTSYHKPEKKFKSFTYNLEKNKVSKSFFNHKHLKEALVNRFHEIN